MGRGRIFGRRTFGRRTFERGCASLVTLALLTVSGTAAAQAVKPPTREELRIGEAASPPPARRVTVDGDIERGPCPLADPAYAEVRVNFSRIDFANLSAVPPAALDPSWRDLAGRDLPIASLCDIRDRAATLLRQQGYLAAVQVPPQRIEAGGVVRMDVLIARLTEVQVRGDPGHGAGLIARHLAKLTRSRFLNIGEAERQLLLLGDIPGFDVRLTLRPTATAGEVFGDVLVVRRPLEVIGGVQDMGSTAAGRFGIFAQATINDLTGMGDRTQLSVFNTVQPSEQTVVQLGHDLALGTDGWRLGGSLVYGHSKPSLAGAPITSRTLIGRIEASYPLIRRQVLTVKGTAGAEVIDQQVDFTGVGLSEDRLRVLFARVDLDLIDKASLGKRAGYSDSEPLWRLAATVEARQGLGGFGASRDCKPISDCFGPRPPISNFFADPGALVLRAEAVAEYRPLPGVTIVMAPRAQFSPSQLLGYEQFSLGNYTIGRGLDPGILQGDSGAGTSLELRFGKRSFRRSNRFSLLPYAFVDAAWVWANDEGLTGDPRRALTAGGGVRVPWGDRVESNFTVAVPLERAASQTRRGNVRLLFTIVARLAPWKDS